MAKRFVVLCFVFAGACALSTEELAPGDPAALGFSGTRLAALGKMIERKVERGELPGAVIWVARRGRTVVAEAYGAADLETNRAMRVDDIFRLASATKFMVSVGFMTLYEESRVQLSDPVSDYLPQFETMTVFGDDGVPRPAKEILRVRDLLRHTAGYGYGYTDPLQSAYREAGILTEGPGLDWTHDWTLEEWAARLATVPAGEEPGTAFSYGLGHDLLGLVIERVSGMPLDRFMRERVFDPLGMDDTDFVVPKDRLSRLTSIYDMTGDEPVALDRPPNSPFRELPKAPSGGGGWDGVGNGGLVSTAPDFARLLQMVLNGGELDGVRLLGSKTVELMQVNHLAALEDPTSFWTGVGFGFGYAVVFDRDQFGEIGSEGMMWWAGSTNTSFWLDPEEELLGVFMTQVRPFGHGNVMDLVNLLTYQAIVD